MEAKMTEPKKSRAQEVHELGEAWDLLILELLKTKPGKLLLKIVEGLNRLLLRLQRKRAP